MNIVYEYTKNIDGKMNSLYSMKAFALAGYCIIIAVANAQSPNTSLLTSTPSGLPIFPSGIPIPPLPSGIPIPPLPSGIPGLPFLPSSSPKTISPSTSPPLRIPPLKNGEVSKIGNLTYSPLFLASGSTVTVTSNVEVTSSPPFVHFPMLWQIDSVSVAFIRCSLFDCPLSERTLLGQRLNSTYKNRISLNITPSTFTLPATVTVSLTIANVTDKEDGLLVTLHDVLKYKSSVNLRVIKDCGSSLPYGVSVIGDSLKYRSEGTFTCPRNGKLFFSNGTAALVNRTTCNSQSVWNGQNDLQCWSAPNVTLNSVFSRVNSTLFILCTYAPVLPKGQYTLFFVGDQFYNISERFLELDEIPKSARGKSLYCQADTPFTRMYNKTGRSPPINISDYPPYQISATKCYWYSDSYGTCTITFYSSPPSVFRNLTKSGNTTINQGDNNVTVEAAKHQFIFVRNKVTTADSGSYQLIVSFAEYPGLLFALDFSIYVYPLPSPSETCSWFVGQSGACEVRLTSDGVPYSLTKNGEIIEDSTALLSFIHSSYFKFEIKEVTKANEGKYALTIISPSDASTPVVVFDIFVLEYPFDSALIIGLTVLVLILLVVIIVGLVHHARVKKTKKKQAAQASVELKSLPNANGRKGSIPTATGHA